VLAQRCLYGGTHAFLSVECPQFGIGVDWIDADDPGSWQQQLTPTTRAIYVETMTNPLLEVADLEGIVAFARAHGLVSMIDNTFASPVNFRPIDLGFDLSMHSGTKYLNGHGDIAAGAVIGNADWIAKITQRLNHLGGCLDPHAAFLLHRGLKTLGVRVRHQNESGLRVAQFLAAHPAVERVNYPGLDTHPNQPRARRLFGGFAGTLSFDLVGGSAAADRFMDAVQLPKRAPSLGSVDTLMMRPAAVSHVAMTPEQRAALGIGDGLVRMSVGLETVDDLIEDFDRALAACREVAVP
jgi:cystathionine beta-lyase/cystathionine gamma-synthase